MTRLFKLAGLAVAASLSVSGAAQAQDLLLAPAAPGPHPANYMYQK